jgi:hypothetical protein
MEKLTLEHNSSAHHDAVRTLISTNGKNQLEMISIADKKANMITALCAALIFAIIALFCMDFSMMESTLLNSIEFVLPMGILLAFSCVSAICAILALKPKIVYAKKEGKSVLFFHNHYRMSLDDYKEEMHQIMESPDMIYDHMLRNMYFNGLVLERKYALLGFAYYLFLLAIVCSVSSYVVASVI